MKALKIAGLVVLALVAVVVVIGLILPKEVSTERSIVIDAPKDVVFAQLANLEAMQSWSPWAERDPNAEMSYEGTPGAVGSSMSWKGNKEMGSGTQEIVAVEEGKRIDTKLKFFEPMESEADAWLVLDEVEGGTKVTWGLRTGTPFPVNIMMQMIGMKKSINNDFDNLYQ